MRKLEPARSGGLLLAWALIRMSLVLVAWLALFLVVILGYLTIPIILLGGFLAVLTAIDLYRWYRRKQVGRQKGAEKP